MDHVLEPNDSLMRRQRAAHTTYSRLRAELAALAPDHPAYPALCVAVRQAERHWQKLDTAADTTDTFDALAALGLSRRDLSPWAA